MGPSPQNYSNLDLTRPSKSSDFHIQCGGSSWYVHKRVVCIKSNYFELASKGNFPGGDYSGCILTEYNPKIIKIILRFLYDDEYKGYPGSKNRPINDTEYASTVEKAYKLYNRDDHRNPHTKSLKRKLKRSMEALQTHIEVYIAADSLLIDSIPQAAAAKALDIIQVAELLPDPRLVEHVGLMLHKTRSNDRFLRNPSLVFLLSKQDLTTKFNKPLDTLLQEKEVLAYTMAKRASYYKAVESINTRLNGIFKRLDKINRDKIPEFYSTRQQCPILDCEKTLYRSKKLDVSTGADLGECFIGSRQRTFFEARCQSPGCNGMRYVGVDPYPEMEEWKELAAEAESLVKPDFEIGAASILVENHWDHSNAGSTP